MATEFSKAQYKAFPTLIRNEHIFKMPDGVVVRARYERDKKRGLISAFTTVSVAGVKSPSHQRSRSRNRVLGSQRCVSERVLANPETTVTGRAAKPVTPTGS
jgi:hypothetical protein